MHRQRQSQERQCSGTLVRRKLLPATCLWLAFFAGQLQAASAELPVTDDCFEGLTQSPEVAARRCSDAIARLGYVSQTAPADQSPLAAAYANRAVARTRSGDFEGAAADLTEALTLSPDNPAMLLNRGNLWLAQGQAQAALLDYQQARELLQGSPDDLSTLSGVLAANSALAYRGMADITSAERSLKSADDLAALAVLDAIPEPADNNALPVGQPQ